MHGPAFEPGNSIRPLRKSARGGHMKIESDGSVLRRVAAVGAVLAATVGVSIGLPASGMAAAVSSGDVVSGTLRNGAGTPIAYMPVKIYATDVALDAGSAETRLPLVAQAKTDAS